MGTFSGAFDTPFTEETVTRTVVDLFTRPSTADEAHCYLIAFQRHTSSWPICINILNKHASLISSQPLSVLAEKVGGPGEFMAPLASTWQPSSETLSILCFASQTLCSQAQAGFPQQLSESTLSTGATLKEIRNGLSNLIYNFRYGPLPVMRQLCVAVCACLMFSFQEPELEGEPAIEYLLDTFGKNIGEEGYAILTEIFVILAEEIFNKRVALTFEKRDVFIQNCLKRLNSIWDAADKIYEHANNRSLQYWMDHPEQLEEATLPEQPSREPPPSPLMCSSLKCFTSWIIALLNYLRHLEGTDSEFIHHDPSIFNDTFNSFGHQNLFLRLLKNLASSSIEMLQICSEGLMHFMGLSISRSEDAFNVLIVILKAYEHLKHTLTELHAKDGGIRGVNAHRLIVISHPLIEMSKVHFGNLLHYHAGSRESLSNVVSFVLEMLRHKDISVKQQSLDFWYNLLSHVISTKFEEKENESAGNSGECRYKEQIEDLKAFYKQFVNVLVDEVAYTTDLEDDPDFDFMEFLKFRDDAAINLNESTLVVGHEYVISFTGEEVVSIFSLQAKPNDVDMKPSWYKLEACLFVLTTVAPKAPAGKDEYIPMTLAMLPMLIYPNEGHLSLLLRCAASRLAFWTAGYIGMKRELFASIFQLVACEFMPFVLNLERFGGALENQRYLTECTIVETLNSLTASAGSMLVMEGNSDDINIVLNALTALIVAEGTSLENKASLIFAAGSILSFLPKNRMQELHSQLIEPLAKNVSAVLDNLPGSDKLNFKECVHLYFTALQCVCPVESYPLPKLHPDCKPLSALSKHRHPVLDVVEAQWDLVRKVFLQRGKAEFVVEQGCDCLSCIVSTCRGHIVRYPLIYSILDLLGESYTLSPSFFQLGAFRTITGILANPAVESILLAISSSYEIYVEYMLAEMEKVGEAFVFEQPDLVGMTIDCGSTILINALLAEKFVRSNWFLLLFQTVIKLTPTCHHPKVLHTNVLFLSRLVGWINPPPHLFASSPDFNVTWLMSAAQSLKAYVTDLLRCKYGSTGVSCLHAVIGATIKAIVNVHGAVQSWIGSATKIILPLLLSPVFGESSRVALREAIMAIPPQLMPAERKESFYLNCTTETQYRKYSDMLQRAADETVAGYQRSQFKHTGKPQEIAEVEVPLLGGGLKSY